MRYEHEGRSLWFATADAPAPAGEIEVADRAEMTVAVQPADASNRVEIRYKVNDGPIKTVPAAWLRNEPGTRTQFFRGEIAGLKPGDTVRYVPVCHCAGRSFPSGAEIERLEGSFRIAGGPVASVVVTPATARRAELTAARPAPSPRGSALADRPATAVVPSLPIAPVATITSQPASTIPPIDRPSVLTPRPQPEPKAAAAPVALSGLAPKLRLERAPELLRALDKHGIRTLDDVRKTGGLAALKDLPVARDHPAVKALEAHAQLAVISPDPDLNAKLIEKGFGSIHSITSTPKSRFATTLGETEKRNAEGLHDAAKFAEGLFGLRAIAERVGRANLPVSDDDRVDDRNIDDRRTDDRRAGDADSQEEPACECEDCRSAVSPLAYLVHLISYAQENLVNGGKKIDVRFLEGSFHQLFSQLTSHCNQLQDMELQVRLCIEVLRRYRVAHASDPNILATANTLAEAEAEYRKCAYFALLGEIGTSYDELRAARLAPPEERIGLADRLGIAVDHLDKLILDISGTPLSGGAPPLFPALTEGELERLFGLASTTNTTWDPFRLASPCELQKWRRERLRQQWWEQDWPTDPFDEDHDPAEARLPIIDPDIIGPDDFRIPTSADPKFALWEKRRRWVDNSLRILFEQRVTIRGMSTYDFDAMVATTPLLAEAYGNPLTTFPVPSVARSLVPARLSGPPTVGLDIDELREAFAQGDSEEVRAAEDRLKLFDLPRDAFDRLAALHEKDQLAESDPRLPALSEDEWSEVASIIVASCKRKLYSAWRKEEKAAQVILSSGHFWTPLREPLAGPWPPRPSPSPLIDPQLQQITDLAEPTAGSVAIRLWQDRQQQLADMERELKRMRRTDGLDGMLRLAMGDPLPNNLGQIATAFDAIAAALDNPDRTIPGTQAAAGAAEAENNVKNVLHLSLEAFRLLLDIRAREGGELRKQPRLYEWANAGAILLTAYKEIQLYPTWTTDEQNAGLTYWNTLKAKLPPWRATPAARQMWREAWSKRSAPPLIDPDVIDDRDLREPDEDDPSLNPATDVLSDRSQFASTLPLIPPSDVPAFDAAFKGRTDIDLQELDDLANRRTTRTPGVELGPRLRQLDLTYAEYEELSRLRAVVVGGSKLSADEWNEVRAIHREKLKRREYSNWRNGETHAGITLSPDFFRIPQLEEEERAAVVRWRASLATRQDWQAALKPRIDQQNAIVESLVAAFGAAEESALPKLRDALVEAMPPPPHNEPKAKWVTDNLLIDASMGGCSRTTRLAQAITTLQLLLWSVRNALLKDTHPNLSLGIGNGTFDNVWGWLGSYGSWRSARFILLYPESFADPALRPEAEQSPGFESLLADSNLDFDPEKAFTTYQQYYDDVCNLRVEAVCQLGNEKDPRGYLYARSPISGRCYWSETRDRLTTRAFQQTFWFEIKSTYLNKNANTLVQIIDIDSKIIGAVPFKIANEEVVIVILHKPDTNRLTIFIHRIQNEQEEGSIVYPPTILLLPERASSVVVNQAGAYFLPLVIMRSAASGMVSLLSVDDKMGNWRYVRHISLSSYDILAAIPVSANADGPCYLFGKDDRGNLYYGIVDEKQPFFWCFLSTGKWLGAFAWHRPPSYRVLVWIARGEDIYVGLPQPPRLIENPPPDVFQAWLLELTNHRIDLSKIPLTDNEKKSMGPADGLFQFDSLYPLLFDEFSYPKSVQKKINQCNYAQHVQEVIFSVADRIAWTQSDNELVKANTYPSSDIATCLRVLFLNRFVDKLISLFGRGNYDSIFDHVSGCMWKSDPAPKLSITIYDRDTVKESIYLRTTIIPEENALALHAGGQADPQYLSLVFRTRQDHWCRGAFDSEAVYGRAPFNETYHAMIVPADDGTSPTSPCGEKRNAADTQTLLSLYDQPSGWPKERPAYASEYYYYEYYYFVPVMIAMRLRRNGDFATALEWFRLVYDFSENEGNRKRWHGLIKEQDLTEIDALEYWKLLGPEGLNPHSIARGRREAYTRFTQLQVIGCLIDYADEQFTEDTAETLERARTLYLLALDLLDELPSCKGGLPTIDNPLVVEHPRIRNPFSGEHATGDVNRVGPYSLTVGLAMESRDARIRQSSHVLAHSEGFLAETTIFDRVPFLVGEFARDLAFGKFCIPPNPIIESLRVRAENNLKKMRECRNIGGFQRTVEPYAGPTDAVSGFSGALALIGATTRPRPSVYRSAILISRAKDLASRASDMEDRMREAIQRRDDDLFNRLEARHALELSQAQVQVQQLAAQEAAGEVKLAAIQQARSRTQVSFYERLLREGISDLERASLYAEATKASTSILGFASSLVNLAIGEGPFLGRLQNTVETLSGAAAATAPIFSQQASYERREEEWRHQLAMAQHDQASSDQQHANALIAESIASAEGYTADLRVQHSREVLNFLDAQKELTADFYDWMAKEYQAIYRYFLQQATAVARVAAGQLAFERQSQDQPVYIRADYWNPAAEASIFNASKNDQAGNRRGLTGSARLTQDIYRLEQYALDTERRKVQLAKTISLSQLDPFAFQGFREQGVMTFRIPLSLFDRDFPGHYLRLIKRVRLSVIALIPPNLGIRATLSTTSISSVVVGPNIFETISVRREPESVALTSPRDATGLFELQPQSETLFPFEGLGVDTSWELRMPKAANPFDFETIADVLLTTEYTALDSYDYRQQVVRRLDDRVSADRAFSFRHELADQWYDLHNPDQTATPMSVRFRTRRGDFPPNVDQLSIQQVVLYFVRPELTASEIRVSHLRFAEEHSSAKTGGGATTVRGVISTRSGSAPTWVPIIGLSPVGEWELALPDTPKMRDLFEKEQISDILFVLTYGGRTPPWPP